MHLNYYIDMQAYEWLVAWFFSKKRRSRSSADSFKKGSKLELQMTAWTYLLINLYAKLLKINIQLKECSRYKPVFHDTLFCFCRWIWKRFRQNLQFINLQSLWMDIEISAMYQLKTQDNKLQQTGTIYILMLYYI
jgi:hypothetical protein